MKTTNGMASTQEAMMSNAQFADNAKTFAKRGALGLMTALASLSCGGGDDPKPVDTNLTGKVYTITGKITGLTVNTIDSTLSIRTGGFDTPSEILLSAQKNVTGGKVNRKVKGSLLENITLITNNTFQYANPYAELNVSSADQMKKFIGRSTEGNNDRVDALKASGATNAFGSVISEGKTSPETLKYIIENANKLVGATGQHVGKRGNNIVYEVTN